MPDCVTGFDPAEKAGSEDHAGQHFTNHRRHLNPYGKLRKQTYAQQDQRQEKKKVVVIHRGLFSRLLRLFYVQYSPEAPQRWP